MTYTEFKRKIIKILRSYGFYITSTWTNEDILEALVNHLKEKESEEADITTATENSSGGAKTPNQRPNKLHLKTP